MSLRSPQEGSPTELRQRLERLDVEVRERVEKRGRPWSGVPLIRYLAGEVIYLEEAWSLIQRTIPVEKRVPTLSMLGLEGVLEEHHRCLHEVIIERAVGLKDSNWAVACRQYLEPTGEDRGIEGVPIVPWEDFLERRGQPLILLGPFTRYPRKRGQPRPLIDIQLVPGNFPSSREIALPAKKRDGMAWFSCFELEVIRVLKKSGGEQDFVSRISLAPDRWLKTPEEREDAFSRHGQFEVKQWLFQGHDDIVVMGQHRWRTELCLALALARGGLLSRSQKNQVITDLAPRMEKRLEKSWQGGERRARAARRLARELFNYLAENFRRPLYKNALSGALKAGVKTYGEMFLVPQSVSSRAAKAIKAAGVELASDPEDLDFNTVVDFRRNCAKVMNELDTEIARSPAWLASRTGLDIEAVKGVLELARDAGQARHTGHGRYCRIR